MSEQNGFEQNRSDKNRSGQNDRTPIIDVRGVSKTFTTRSQAPHLAVNNVSLAIYPGETVALVGESGSGKTSVSRIVLALLKPDTGDVLLQGRSLLNLRGDGLRKARTVMQPVFQDSGAAFNPRRTIAQLLRQAIDAGAPSDVDRQARAIELLELVRLRPGADYLGRFPHELSGGQRQRLAIARAIATNPELIVADEPLSGADVSIRGQVLNLLLDLQAERHIAYLFITHDIAVARSFAHRVIVMYKGEIVEQGPAEQVIAAPTHPYTKRLVDSALRYG